MRQQLVNFDIKLNLNYITGVFRLADKEEISMKMLPFLTFVCTLSMLSYHSVTQATSFNGPTELSDKEFNELKINGPSRLINIKADSLILKGPANFTRIKVKGKSEISGASSGEEGEFSNLTIHGSFWGSKIEAKNLHVDGETALEEFKISDNVTINGPLKAKNGSFNNINAVNAPVALYNVTVNNITVKKRGRDEDSDDDKNDNNNGNGKNNEVKLAGNTVVSGNITFESGNGVVFIRDKTAQLKGKVIGGKIKQN